MAVEAIKVPGVGESVTEGIIARWMQANGSFVKQGEPLYELETDKASNVVNAPISGVLTIAAEEGATVPIGATIAHIDTSAKAAKSDGVAAKKPAMATNAPAAAPEKPASKSADQTTPSPAVRRIAAETGVALADVPPTGPGGRVTKGDVIDHLERGSAPAPTEPAPGGSMPSSPSVPPKPVGSRTASRKKMTGIRQRIAARLVEAQQTAAILTTFNEADLSQIIAARTKYKESFQKRHGVGLGFMSFFVRASIEALKAFPNVNSRIDGSEVITPDYHDIGVAVSTERGLMVPVVRDADRMSFADIEKSIADYAKKAREGSISVSDLEGGTFTITNGGIFGSLLSTPILNPPQTGILGMHKIQERPVVVDGQIVARPMMYLALSYDHRLVDGREAVGFLVRVKECIESPDRMLFDI